jgi:hypothetical protein
MLRSKTARWIMWLFLGWLLLTACVMLFPFAVAMSSPTGPLVVGATIGFLERARIGRSGVGLGRVVSDLLEREGREFRGEFA